jgi:hypothetical protein
LAFQRCGVLRPGPRRVEQLMKRWRCRICGYIHVGDEPPERCRYCAALRDQFFLMKPTEAPGHAWDLDVHRSR